ncbi:MAG: endonuclease III [Bacteroidetes bacterium]|nr:endonuclease III [Bacteroidota bacterium]
MVTNRNIGSVLRRIRQMAGAWPQPSVSEIAESSGKPFNVLVSTILSLRTKDAVTLAASRRLFGKADRPETMVKIPLAQMEKLIYPVAFYKMKSRTIVAICRQLLDAYDGRVPASMEALMKFKGVGRKTANLTLVLGFGIPAMCVDTHVHRISNRLGYIQTKTADKSEMALRSVLPKRHWMTYNDLLVAFGQNICKPVSPHCSLCPIHECPRLGVGRSR